MLLLIVEILLVVAAWRNGWAARALLPILGELVLAFLMGVVIGASGGSTTSARGLGVLLDLAVIAVLAVMARKAPRAERSDAEQDAEIPLASHSSLQGD